MPGATLDAGGLIALDRDDRRIVVLLARARETSARITVPASALAQAIRRPERQAPRLSGPGVVGFPYHRLMPSTVITVGAYTSISPGRQGSAPCRRGGRQSPVYPI